MQRQNLLLAALVVFILGGIFTARLYLQSLSGDPSAKYGEAEVEYNTNPPAISSSPFQDGEGKDRTLQEFQGKAVILNFWATWCRPCVDELPQLDALQEDLTRTGKNITVIALAQDFKGRDVVSAFLKDRNIMHLPVYTDRKNTLLREMKVGGLPTTIFIDRAGNEVARIQGFVHWDSAQVKALLDKLAAPTK